MTRRVDGNFSPRLIARERRETTMNAGPSIKVSKVFAKPQCVYDDSILTSSANVSEVVRGVYSHG